MHNFRIRNAKPGDEAGIHASHMRSINEVCIQDHTAMEISGWGNRPLGDRWIEAIQTGYVWVVESNGAIFGHAYIRFYQVNEEPRASIEGLYLAPEALKQGFGSALCGLMLDAAKDRKVLKVNLQSTITAHSFYEKMGFVDAGSMNTVSIGGNSVRCFPMTYILEP